MTKKNLLKIIGLGFLGLILIVVVIFYFAGSSIMSNAISKAASETLQVPVTIKGIDLSPLSGRVGIRGLVIKNPPGYANETLLDLNEAAVQLTDFKSLFSDTIKIKLIKLDGTRLTMEQKGLTNNLKEILDKLPKEEPKEKPAAKPASEGKSKNLNIQRLEITATNVKIKLLPIPGKSDTVSMNLDPIIMDDFGTDGTSTGKLFAKVMGALAVGVTKQGVGLLPDDMVKGVGSTIGKTAELGKSTIKEGQKAVEAGKGVVEGLGGLFGGKKSDPNKK